MNELGQVSVLVGAVQLPVVPKGVGDVTIAVEVVRHPIAHSNMISAQAYRQAAQGGGE